MKYFYFLIIVLFVSCSKKTAANQASDDGCQKNSAGTYSICLLNMEESKSNTEPAINYEVVDSSGKTIFKGSVDRGSVEWMNDDAVAITTIPGNISPELSKDDFVKVYVISKGKVMTKKDYMEEN